MEGDLLRALAHGIQDEVREMQDKLRWGVALYTPPPAEAPADAEVTPRARTRSARRTARGSAE